MFKCTYAIILLMLSSISLADGIGLGQPLPELSIADRGELVLENEKFGFKPWVLPASPGKIHVLQYMAATRGASKLNEPFTDRLKALPNQNFQVTTLLNLDDAMWGTSGMVIGELKKSKLEFPDSSMIVDADGVGRERWQLQSKSSAIVIVDAVGTVRYLKEGAMNEQDIEHALALINRAAEQEGS